MNRCTQCKPLAGSSLTATIVAIACVTLTSGVSTAQVKPVEQAVAACRVVELGAVELGADATSEAAVDRSKPFAVTCGLTSVLIGAARSYESEYNPVLRSLAVVLREPGRTRVLLISPVSRTALKIDDVSRDLSRLSGRMIDDGLGEVAVDLSAFAKLGRVSLGAGRSLQGFRRGASAARTADLGQSTLDLTPYVSAYASIKQPDRD